MKMVYKLLNFIFSFLLLIILWQLLITLGGYDEVLFPAPATVFVSLIELISNGRLIEDILVSLGRFATGYLLAIIPAIILGLILGRLPILWKIFDPIVQVLRPVSPVAWSPFIVLWFGIGNIPAIVIIFIAAFFPVLLTTVAGARKVNADYIKIAQNLEVNKLEFLIKFVFPAAFPTIVNGLRVAVGTAWIFLVAGEMVGSQSGLGFLIVDARNTLNLANVLAGIVVIGILGFILDRFISLFERMVGRYYGSIN